MAITYNIVDIRGVAAEPILEEILFENKTVSEGLVTFEEDVKAETIFTEGSTTVTIQAYTSGAPTSAGAQVLFDVPVTPIKLQVYNEFDPNAIRFSRFKRDLKPGAWNILSSEFERAVIGGMYAKRISATFENYYWSGAKSATKTAVAALTPGTSQSEVGAAEQTLVAAMATNLVDSIVTKMIYNSSNASLAAGVGGRIKVAGTTITSSNIKTEYDKVYSAILPEVLESAFLPFLYVPRSHKQLINKYNNVATNFKDVFVVKDGKYFLYDLEIKFVPVAENVIIAAPKEHLFWCTDLMSDISKVEIDKIANNREDMFLKVNATMETHVANQAYNVLYVG